MIHVLVVEDDKKLNQAVCTHLNDSGFSAKGGMSANLAYDEMFNNLYDLIMKKTFFRALLMDEFWGMDSETSLRAVDVYVTKLRDKFSACDGFKIVTVRGG